VIYPGKVTEAETFRIGNIGHLFPDDMRHLISTIRQVLAVMRVNVPVTYE
jgi:2-aminoethylphosphonate-pyruvate transaminase